MGEQVGEVGVAMLRNVVGPFSSTRSIVAGLEPTGESGKTA